MLARLKYRDACPHISGDLVLVKERAAACYPRGAMVCHRLLPAVSKFFLETDLLTGANASP